MGRNSRKNRRRLLAQIGRGDSVPGGYQGAIHRSVNGQATPADVDFLTRMRREAMGKDGYSGNHKDTMPSYTFHTPIQPITQSRDNEVFHCAEAGEVTGKCPLNPPVPAIHIPITMWECFLACCKEYDTEWIALLMGKLDKDDKGKDTYIIDKFYFPPQTASGAHVDVPTGVKPRAGTIGAIHSHVNMGVFWSGTDIAHSNWPVEIVINRKEEYEALSRYQLKCGEWAKGKSEVLITGSYVSKRIDALVKDAFAAGEAMRKARLASVISVATPTTPTTPSLPAGIHPDDQEEVAEAIVVTGTVSACRTCKSPHHFIFYNSCRDPWHDTGFEPAYCKLSKECVRPFEHAGWCKRADDSYFQMEGGKVVKDDRWDKAAATKDAAATSTEQANLTFPPQDSTTQDEPLLPLEEYCPTCEGDEFVEVTLNGKKEIMVCQTCKGDGLSQLGRIRAAEGMVH